MPVVLWTVVNQSENAVYLKLFSSSSDFSFLLSRPLSFCLNHELNYREAGKRSQELFTGKEKKVYGFFFCRDKRIGKIVVSPPREHNKFTKENTNSVDRTIPCPENPESQWFWPPPGSPERHPPYYPYLPLILSLPNIILSPISYISPIDNIP